MIGGIRPRGRMCGSAEGLPPDPWVIPFGEKREIKLHFYGKE